MNKFTVTYDASIAHSEKMQEAIVDLGYRPSIVSSDAGLKDSANIEQLPELVSEAMLAAGEGGQLVFLDFHAPWCGACKKLEETTLRDPGVQSALSEFVFLKVDTDEHPSVGKYFNVVGLPTILVISASGKELYRNAGLLGAEALTHQLGDLLEDRDDG